MSTTTISEQERQQRAAERQKLAEAGRERRLMNSSMWVSRLVRESRPTNPIEFKSKLYEVLWTRAEGFETSAQIAHELYKRTEICAIYFARTRGFDTFEQMLHSEELEQVVIIERIYWKPTYIIYHYRASLNNSYAAIRKRNTQIKKHFKNTALQELNRKLAGLPTEEQMRELTDGAPKKQRKKREIHGSIISYEVDVCSDDEKQNKVEEYYDEEMEDEQGDYDDERDRFGAYDEDGDEWGVGMEDGDSSGISTLVRNSNQLSDMNKEKRCAKGKRKWQNDGKKKQHSTMKMGNKCDGAKKMSDF